MTSDAPARPSDKPPMLEGTYFEPILGRYLAPPDPSWTRERFEQIAGSPQKDE